MLLENNPYPQDPRVRPEAESLVRGGYDVTVIAPRVKGQVRYESIAGVNVRRFYNIEGRGVFGFLGEYIVAATMLQLAALRALLTGVDVLHLHNPPDVLFPVAAVFRLLRKKVIFDHHDLFPETMEVKFGSGIFTRAAQACERLTYQVANHVVATNQSYAEVALTRGRKTPQEVTVVRNGPPADWLQLPSSINPDRLECVQLGYVGAISNQDGVDTLASVLAHLREQQVDASLVVVGEGDGRSTLEREMSRRGLCDRLTITGWLPWEDVPVVLGNADICVDPAPATEVNNRSTMIKIAEYLALGRPVVAFELLETRRTAGDAAVLVPPGDVEAFAAAIARLAREPAERQRLSELGRRRAAELVWTYSEEKLLGAYQLVLNGRHLPVPS